MRTYTRKRPAVPQLIEGVKELCRLCLERAEGAVPIFADGSDVSASLALRIMICVGLEISHEECLPNILCSRCHCELEKYYAFRKKCEISHRKLKSHLYAFQMKQCKSELEQKENEKAVENEDSVADKEGELFFVVNLDNNIQLSRQRPGLRSLLRSENQPEVNLTNFHDICNLNMNTQSVQKNPTDDTVAESSKTVHNIESVFEREDSKCSKTVVDNIIVPECSETVVVNNNLVPEINKTVLGNNNIVPEISKTVLESNDIVPEISKTSLKSNDIVPEISKTCLESNDIVPEISKTSLESNDIGPEISKTVVESNNVAPETSEVVIKSESDKFEVEIVPEPTSPDVSNFLSAMLVELGILTHQGEGLMVNCESRVLQVEMADGSHLTLQLEEEDDPEKTIEKFDSQPSNPLPVVAKCTGKDPSSDGDEVVDKTSKPLLRPRCVDPTRWCAQCGRTFASRASCVRHARAVHARARPHACGECGRRFAQLEVMRRHELVHQDVRPFQCSECSKSFTQRGSLVAHARSHLPPGERHLALHQCPKCPKLFLHSSGLSRHLPTHAGRVHACGGCARLFADRSSLRRHSNNTGHTHPETNT